MRSLRTLELRKAPSVSETLDWARTLVVLGIESIDAAGARDTLHILLKYQTDIERAAKELLSAELLSGPGPAVLDLLSGFVTELRQAGLPVSLTEHLDAAEALHHIPLEDREALKYALGATLVKSSAALAHLRDGLRDLLRPALGRRRGRRRRRDRGGRAAERGRRRRAAAGAGARGAGRAAVGGRG